VPAFPAIAITTTASAVMIPTIPQRMIVSPRVAKVARSELPTRSAAGLAIVL
jgi:hypothetical protein